MGPAGAGALAEVINGSLASKDRFKEMRSFFSGVGAGYAAGLWEDAPKDRPEFREAYKRRVAGQAKRAAAEEPI